MNAKHANVKGDRDDNEAEKPGKEVLEPEPLRSKLEVVPDGGVGEHIPE
jgi:hypothetical protein